MTRRSMLRAIDRARVEDAIRRAEQRTSGEIRVSLSPLFWGDPERVAHRAFDRLGMRTTRERNGILFFVIPSRRRFVVLGDEGIHAKVSQDFWERVAAAVSERFREGDFTEGLVRGITLVGEQLAAHFPFDATADVNEHPDDVDIGGHS